MNQITSGRVVGGLGNRLRAAREAADLSGHELADRLGWSQSKISKIETGRQLLTEAEVVRWAQATDTDPGPLLSLHGKATVEHSAWKDRISKAHGGAEVQDDIAALEQSCTYLAEYQPAFIPGRLQTPGYMRELSEGDEFLVDDGIDDLGPIIARRVRRQSILYESGRTIVHVVGEAALRIRIRRQSVETQRRQLIHLAEVASLPGHTFGVVPFSTPSPIAPATGFGMYDRDLVVIEALTGELQVTDPAMVARYNRWLDQLLDAAIAGEEASALCRQIAAEL